ncbi:LuxR C-terminal-related transcriptional regulator [Rhizobium sp. RCAM05973]|uniref:helix-turn-helix transcriptional regulator n=1 Tax=Rhizobium sp. RCAM05973 TaxID=2994066 RepID=UPI0022EC0558|nr:LuxR C-terminal-related transcriptional regulator [Rhizobium sp. RCAM05973]
MSEQHEFAQRMSDLIGAIYDCVLMPEKWGCYRRDTREFNFHNAILSVTAHEGIHLLGALVGVDSYWSARMLNYGSAVTDAWGGIEKLTEYPLEEPVVQSRAMPGYDLEGNRYFVEWVRPQGITDAVNISLEHNTTTLSNFTLGRHGSAGPITDGEIEGLRMLAPHIRRAVAISQVLELKTIEISTFASTLDTFNSAIVLVDEDAICVHTNAVATAMLNAKDPLTLNDGRLALPRQAATAALKEAVKSAATGPLTSPPRRSGIPATRRDGTPMILHVMPLHRDILQNAVAAIFVSPSVASPQMPADALALLYGLTPAETRVFEMIVAGQTQRGIAVKLGLAASTIKTHLLRVFEKTGCKRQTDLVRLAASLSIPL